MRAVISVIGNDSVGILAKVSTECAKANANVLEVIQSVLQEYFAMIMVIEITNINCELQIVEKNIKSQVPDMQVHVMHEDIFQSMHRI